jgi:O-antigen ligase
MDERINRLIRVALEKFDTHHWVTLLLTALLFFDPISKSAKSILLGMLSITIILTPSYRQALLALMKETWFKALVLLLLFAVISCIWSPASLKEQIAILRKYDKFIFLPILVVGFRQTRLSHSGIYAFLLAMLCVCILSIGKKQGMLHFGSSDPGHVFLNHIITGIMMSYAAYLAALFFVKEKRPSRYGWALLSLLFSYQIIFVSTGRTGYFLYCLLMVLLVFQFSTWRQLLIRLSAFMIIFTAVSLQSQTIKIKIQ